MFHVKQAVNILRRYCQRLDLNVEENQIEQLVKYSDLIKEWNSKVHLISKNDVEKIIERHIVPALFFVKYLRDQANGCFLRILDVGTGAGLPGAVIAIINPGWKLVLLDSSRKKTLFLRRIFSDFYVDVDVVCERYEKYADVSNMEFDWVVARAVAPLNELIALVRPHLDQGVKLLTIKGINFTEELECIELNKFRISAWNLDGLIKTENYLKNKCLVKVEKIYG